MDLPLKNIKSYATTGTRGQPRILADIKIKKAVVTGGRGFIGSHIVDKLVREGVEVHVIDNRSSQCHEKFAHNEKVEQYYLIDVGDYEELLDFEEELFRETQVIFHCAAESRIQPATNDPLRATQTNVVGTSNLLEISRRYAIPKFIYSSSSSVYGNLNKAPYREEMLPDPLNPYAATKLAGEHLCEAYTKLGWTKAISLRYFNVYGPGEPLKGLYAPVIGRFLRQAEEGIPLTIIGDGTQKRDFTHVYDVVEANWRAAHYGGNRTLFNIGTGVNHSIISIARMISDTVKFVDARPGEAVETRADNAQASVELGWSHTIDLRTYIESEVKER